MFKNFDKVFKFSFKNQAGTNGYKVLTAILGLLMLVLPPVIMMIVGYSMNHDKALEPCDADTVYVVNNTAADQAFFDSLGNVSPEEYKNIKYVLFEDFDKALEASKADPKSFVLKLSSENGLKANIIIPEESMIKKNRAKNYLKFIDRNAQVFSMGLAGVNAEEADTLSVSVDYKTYTESGFMKDISMDEDTDRKEAMMREQVMKVVGYVVPYATILLLYFVLLSYGNSLSQSVVMEKESKLMDTMLISVRPESLIFGKLIATIASVMLQILIWVLCLIAGFTCGNILAKSFYPESQMYLTVFFDGMKQLNVFRPWNIALALLFLLLGTILYLSLAAIAGAMSSNKEEVSGRSTLFVFPMLISFLILIGAGGLSTSTVKTWMLIFPFTGTLVMPSNVMLGNVSPMVVIASLIFFVALSLLLIIVAGKVYKMMSLYKGNKMPIGEILKKSFEKK